MTTRLCIINGPNLNMLGIREPHIYGSTTLEAIETSCRQFADYLGVSLACHQSNHEGEMVELIQKARGTEGCARDMRGVWDMASGGGGLEGDR